MLVTVLTLMAVILALVLAAGAVEMIGVLLEVLVEILGFLLTGGLLIGIGYGALSLMNLL